MSRHRQRGEDTTILPTMVEGLAVGKRMGRRRRVLRLIIPVSVAVAVFAIGAGLWVVWHPSDEQALPWSHPVITPGKSDVSDEGFGQASAGTSASASTRPSLRPSPSLSPSKSATLAAASSVAHYEFNEASGTSAADATGNGNTATVVGGVAFVAGRSGNAVNLNGSSQYVSIPAGILNGASAFTVSAWVRLDSVATWSRLFDFGSGTGVNMFLTPRSAAGTARFAITVSGNGAEQRINAPFALPAGTWMHVAVTLSGGVGTLYVNKSAVGRTSGMTLTPASLGDTKQNWIGRSQYNVDPFLDGVVDDFRIYSHALSASEITALP